MLQTGRGVVFDGLTLWHAWRRSQQWAFWCAKWLFSHLFNFLL